MLKGVDRSKLLLALIRWLSDLFARQRGLPVVFGLVLILVGIILQVVNVFSVNQVVELLGILCNGIGVLIALVGFLLVTPLGGR